MRRSSALGLALAAFVLAGVAGELARSSTPLPLAPKVAIRDALRDPHVKRGLSRYHWDSVAVTPVDSQLERVSFSSGHRVVAEIAVRRDGSVRQSLVFNTMRVPYGDWIAYQPVLLVGLLLLFVLMTAVVPVMQLRNLDVLATVSLVAPVVLLQYRYLGLSILSAVPALAYLMVRCGVRALGSGGGQQNSTPLFDHLTAGWNPPERVRVLRTVLVALALVFVMVGVSSADAVDVIYAVMEGATKLVHGVLPYGHMPGDVIHGDTYPILSYALYAPLAIVAPVSTIWDSVDGALGIAVIAALACGAGLYRANVPARRRREPGEELGGLRAAIAWLAFPPLLIAASTGTTDVLLAAMLMFAVLLWRRPAASSTILAAAGWFKLAPFALVPIWLAPLRGRRLWAAVGALVGVSALSLTVLVGVGGTGGISAMIHGVAYQFSRGSPRSVWSVLGIESLQPLGQAAVIALVVGAAVRLRREPELASDRVRLAALTAAVLLGLELAADYWAFLYLAWVMPLVVLALMSEPAAQPTSERVRSAPELVADPLPA